MKKISLCSENIKYKIRRIKNHIYYNFLIKTDFTNKKAAELIYSELMSNKATMICRFGGSEINFLKLTELIIKGKVKYKKHFFESFTIQSGFFPITFKNMKKFYDLMIEDTKEINILGVWCPEEEFFFREKIKNCIKVPLKDLSPFENDPPWTRALTGKKILVIHPFEDTIKKQYKKRSKLFKSKDILPKFELITFKAVQTIDGENNKFKDWFEALEFMKKSISKIDFDIAIIGCGAYGFPLAAHIKRMGKKAVHFGGGTQLLFGILGKRWEENNDKKISQHINKHWVRPDNNERPKKYKQLENGAYW